MFIDDAFEPLSIEAKVVYGILLQRIKLANRNGWRDEEGRLYVVYPLDQMHKDIGLSTRTISTALKRLLLKSLQRPEAEIIQKVVQELLLRRLILI